MTTRNSTLFVRKALDFGRENALVAAEGEDLNKAVRPKVLRQSDFRTPKPITETIFEELCRHYANGVPLHRRRAFKNQLDCVISEFAKHMSQSRIKRGRKDDLKHLRDARQTLINLRKNLQLSGNSGRFAVRAASAQWGKLVSSEWLRDNFPDDDLLPPKRPIHDDAREVIRPNLRTEERFFDIEEKSLEDRIRFAGSRANDLLCALLKTVESGIDRAVRRMETEPGARGGRLELQDRKYFIANLAKLWIDFGQTVASGKSDFADFCEAVFQAIGWPTEGLVAALPDGIGILRNHR